LKNLPDQLKKTLGDSVTIKGDVHPSVTIVGKGIYIGENTKIDAHAQIQGPVYISDNVFVGHAALIRRNTLLGQGVSIGHATEIKDSIMYPNSKAAHFNFIGDSIIGSSVNLGGGTIISNFEFADEQDRNHTIKIKLDGRKVDTGMEKLGAIVGDRTKTGANSVLSPGSLIGHDSAVYPTICVRKGYVPPGTTIKPEYYDLSTTQRMRQGSPNG
jgi:NDP-sugar pyrophosphorylase family protein